MWCIWGENSLGRKLHSHLTTKIVFPKNRFSVRIFLRNCPLTYFRGQMDYVVRLTAKSFRTNTSLDFLSRAPKIIFPKNTFLVRIFLRNSPITYFPSQTDYVPHLREKFVQTNTLLDFRSNDPKIVFYPENTF